MRGSASFAGFESFAFIETGEQFNLNNPAELCGVVSSTSKQVKKR